MRPYQDRLAVAEMKLADERDHNKRLNLYLDKLEAVLSQAAAQFQLYADNHVAKGKVDKAATNQGWADRCRDAMGHSQPEVADGD